MSSRSTSAPNIAAHGTTQWKVDPHRPSPEHALDGCYDQVRIPPDKAAAARSIRAMLERPARRLIVGHADVIEAACHRLAQAWRREGVEV